MRRSSRRRCPAPIAPPHVRQPFAPAIVTQQRIKPAGCGMDVLRPVAIGRRTHGDIIARILGPAVQTFDIVVNQPEPCTGKRKARRADTATVRIATHGKQIRPVQRPRDKRPIPQVSRLVNLHAPIPFERRWFISRALPTRQIESSALRPSKAGFSIHAA